MFSRLLSRFINGLRRSENRQEPSRTSSVFNYIRARLRRFGSPTNTSNVIIIEPGTPEWFRLRYGKPPFFVYESENSSSIKTVPTPQLHCAAPGTNNTTNRNDTEERWSVKKNVALAAGYSNVKAAAARTSVSGKDFVCAPGDAGAPDLRCPSSHQKEPPCSRNKVCLGFKRCDRKDGTCISYTALLVADSTERGHMGRLLARRFSGLEEQFDCFISISHRSFRLRGQSGYMFEIRGSDYSDVARCRNSLPKFFLDKLITSASSLKEELHPRLFETL